MVQDTGKDTNLKGTAEANESVVYCDVFMQAALKEATCALEEGEVPVGCVLVKADSSTAAQAQAGDDLALQKLIVARGRNATNRKGHALAHAEFVAVEELLRQATAGTSENIGGGGNCGAVSQDLADYVLYVVVEPCIMCAAMLLYNRVRKVYFGCTNPRFGGNGTVLSVHNSYKGCSGEDAALIGYESCGGYRAEEAVVLLQQFYRRENTNAPLGKRKRKDLSVV
ncbi:tRNA-specific adenosine deaminase [Trypanosoma equiperdum]|uniref:Deaminase, putative n=2 Tax=Trypanozoon TaxID=39700 RepID=Q57W17_TRYB2|nr:deaminase, putative [Trypanosoma brucei brucei TREU927]AAX70202.1 deaminase, putative [Trypanosoma brucei]AAZ13183.1 deaminase, putative [Trypanosoma brucei brucei TREU927]SCU68974.1 tRNA-specific adenosine deaminase [Trypanosoma equiperdum]